MKEQKSLKVALLQQELVWENANENRQKIDRELANLEKHVDLIVLPEMFTTGFSMNPKGLAEPMDGVTVQWMQEKAKIFDAAVVGSVIIEEDTCYYNRLLFVHPSGKIDSYDKRHAFAMAGEDKEYTSGKAKLIVDFRGWKICPLICYDLRFPVWARNVENYDVILYVANWPTPRKEAWSALLKARAIENMSYCIGVNRVGVDANGYQYSGNSAVYDYLGKELTTFNESIETILYASLRKEKMLAARTKLPFLEDKDQFYIQ